MVSQVLGRRAMITYPAVLVLGSLVGGAATDIFFAGFPALLPGFARGADHMRMDLSPLELVSAVVLAIMVGCHLGMQIASKLRTRREERLMDNTLVLQVKDMNCQHCVNSIRRAVSGLPGVRGVDVDLDTREIRFDLGEAANSGVLLQAIEDAGFHPEPSRRKSG
jgi:copper chaperone CopZ